MEKTPITYVDSVITTNNKYMNLFYKGTAEDLMDSITLNDVFVDFYVNSTDIGEETLSIRTESIESILYSEDQEDEDEDELSQEEENAYNPDFFSSRQVGVVVNGLNALYQAWKDVGMEVSDKTRSSIEEIVHRYLLGLKKEDSNETKEK